MKYKTEICLVFHYAVTGLQNYLIYLMLLYER